MPKVHFVQSAMKDYPQAGIKKGESYYWWRFFRQPKQLSKTRPKSSQTNPNQYEREVLALAEELEVWEGEWNESHRDDLVSQLEGIRDEVQDVFDNLPEGSQSGGVGPDIEDRISRIDQFIDDLQAIDFEAENEDETPLEQAIMIASAF